MATTNPKICFLLLLLLIISPCLSATNVLFSDIGNRTLHAGESLLSKGSYYDLYMQRDCNLCLYGESKPGPLWCTNTWTPNKSCELTLNNYGQLILSINGNSNLWATHKKNYTEGRYALILNYDGSLGVYGPPIWSVPNSLKVKTTSTTDQYHYSSSLLPSSAASSTIASTLSPGDMAPVGTTIANGDYKLELHGNCNLTLSNDMDTLWYTNTEDPYHLYNCFVAFQDSGELTIKNQMGFTLWSSGTKRPNSVFALRPDGNLAIYGPPIWEVNVKKKLP